MQGALEGPLPLRVSGKATFEILWWDYSVGFDRRCRRRRHRPACPLVDVLGALLPALGDPGNWRVEAPRRDGRSWSRCAATTGPAQVLLHPMGTLTVRRASCR